MGLDMYLDAERFYFRDETKPKPAEVPAGYEVKTIVVEAAYWRKANQIHKWFVDNVQGGEDDCGSHDVSAEQLTTLKDVCYMVLKEKGKKRQALAKELLPPQGGFFFGSTDLDDWYWECLRNTVDQIDKVLKSFPHESYRDWSFTYHSSW